MGEFGIGQPVPRTEDPRLLRGGGKYADDLEFARQAHGYILRSPHAHADIDSIDTAAAEAAPGGPRPLSRSSGSSTPRHGSSASTGWRSAAAT